MSKNTKKAVKDYVPMTLPQQNDFDLRHGVAAGWYRTQDVRDLLAQLDVAKQTVDQLGVRNTELREEMDANWRGYQDTVVALRAERDSLLDKLAKPA